MPRDTKPRHRFGVFATIRGWLLADSVSGETFATRSDAIATARRLAHVDRWRGGRAEVLAQDRPGGRLKRIDPPLDDPGLLEPD